MRWRGRSLCWLMGLALTVGDARAVGAYADRAGTDIVMDAPWRSIRDYVPMLFFFPQFEGNRRVERIRIVECGPGSADRTVFVDAVNGPDTLNGATFVDPSGAMRGGLEPGERVRSFWHYVVRVPRTALSVRVEPETVLLRAEVEWTRGGLFGRRVFHNHRVLRVTLDRSPLPRFDARDLYLDTHVHTIAEQTTSHVLDVNGASKAFAGPVVMLMEAAYALGLVEARPAENAWADFTDRLAVTDHNIFYSRAPYDTGTPPRFGPTASTDGNSGEASWYRAHFGRLAGEEITLSRGSNQDDSPTPNLGHHLLAYGTRHFEGPWHGGRFLTSTLENPNTLAAVLAGMKAANATGFSYAAHPNLAGFVWPPEYFAQAIGLPPYNTASGPAVDSTCSEFLFRGSEVWNTKLDLVARDSGRLPASSAFDHMNPFSGGPEAQRFRSVLWDAELNESLETLFAQIGQGLVYSFRENPGERFVRKLYLSAGSDAHGDFNYADEVTATAVPYSGLLHGNAFARVRTYVLAHGRGTDSTDAVEAFREGSGVITDGPLAMFQLDADVRHDPDAGVARWHDAEARWENADGRIGGSGRFDGGGTALVPVAGGGAGIRSVWRKSSSPGAGEIRRYRFDWIGPSRRDSFDLSAGPEGIADERAVPVALDTLGALVATARDRELDERCITNPVWVAPVRVEVSASGGASGAPPGVAYPAGTLRVEFHFPFSMSADPRTRAFVRPLDARGISTDPEIELAPNPGWEQEGDVVRSRYSATNAVDILVPPQDWDAGSHAAVRGARSFVVYLTSPADMHGNRLNDIGRAFSQTPGRAGVAERRKP